MELHPLLVTLANIVNLRPRQRRLVHALLTEVNGDDDAPARCRAAAPVGPAPAILSVETSSATNGSEFRRPPLRRPRAQPAAKPSAAAPNSNWLKLRGRDQGGDPDPWADPARGGGRGQI